MRTEGIITQLVFNHALRIRMKAELPESTGTESSNPSTTASSPDNVSITEQPAAVEASETSNRSGDETLAQSSSASVKSSSESCKGKKKAKEVPEDKSTPPVARKEATADNLVGKINNLVTTDLTNITDARDFLLLCEHTSSFCRSCQCADGLGSVVYVPLQVALSVWFLYSILGWSAFMGLLVMILLFPIPGYIAKMIQGVQVTRMSKVCVSILY